jgi:hypothetical protein
MKLSLAVLLLALAVSGFAQAAPPTAAAPPADRPASVAPDAAVITIQGVCPAPPTDSADCRTVVTRTEFERLMTVLSRLRSSEAQQTIPLEARRQLAAQYSRLLVYADLAEHEGLANSPEGRELIRFARLQAMTEELARSLRQKATPAATEVQEFYDRHPERFTEYELERVILPVNPRPGAPGREALRPVGEDLRRRAAAGEAFPALQKEAFDRAGIMNPPDVKLLVAAGVSLPEPHASVLRLSPGQISPVIEDSTGFYFYKLDSARRVPLAEKQAEVRELVAGQQADEALQKLGESATFTLNPYYFNPAPASAAGPAATSPNLPGRAVPVEVR